MKQKPAAESSRTLNPKRWAGETDAQGLARIACQPEVTAAVTSIDFQRDLFTGQTLDELVSELERQTESVRRGDLSRPEALLTAQAHALDAIFHKVARLAAVNLTDHPTWGERYLRVALKAQGQCRATLETLAAIKNPPVVIARQANIAHGPQQVNNGGASHAEEIQSVRNKLMEQAYGQRLDAGTTGQAVGRDTTMEAVGEVDGTEER